MLSPVVIDVYLALNFLPTLQSIFPFWRQKAAPVVLSDLLFAEGGALLIFGALLAGVTLFNAWVPDVFRARFTKSIFNLETIRKGREISPALKIGLMLLACGIAYILIAIATTL
jgi:hypothetical protein